MAKKALRTDALIAVSRWFASEMEKKMQLPEGVIRTVPLGVDTSRYSITDPATERRTIGYLSRLCEENGLGILVDAFVLLKKNPENHDLQLRLTGGNTGDDRSFIRLQMKKLQKHGLADDVKIIPDFGSPGLLDFFRGLTLLSVPVLKGEAFGLYLLESMASGIPVVQPALGAFPEITSKARGGIVYQPNTAVALASAVSALLSEPSKIISMGIAGRKGVEEHFDIARVTKEMLAVYESVITKF